jgi:prephenate dehydrogenase
LGRAVRNADIVVLASPVNAIIQTLSELGPKIRRNTIVTDLGSTKGDINDAAMKSLPNQGMFVGSHPLVGSEQKGVENSRDNMFEGKVCIMTPTQQTSQFAKEKVKQMWHKLGAEVHMMSPTDHDQVLAYVSHLPHLIAYGLIETVPTQHLAYTTRSMLEMTRIASSPPQLWNDISMTNQKNLLKSLDEFIKILAQMRNSIVSRNQRDLTYQFTKAKEKRDGIRKQI